MGDFDDKIRDLAGRIPDQLEHIGMKRLAPEQGGNDGHRPGSLESAMPLFGSRPWAQASGIISRNDTPAC